MINVIIVDAGPLIALFDEADRYHIWSSDHYKKMRYLLITCEAVIAEAMYLLGGVVERQKTLFELIDESMIKIQFSLQN